MNGRMGNYPLEGLKRVQNWIKFVRILWDDFLSFSSNDWFLKESYLTQF